jgi:hypothetical protein
MRQKKWHGIVIFHVNSWKELHENIYNDWTSLKTEG